MSRTMNGHLHLQIDRGETQKNVNKVVINYIITYFDATKVYKTLDLPCGKMLLANYIKKLLPISKITGADIKKTLTATEVQFIQMDLSKDFSEIPNEKFDLITSISGIMMFGNTQAFIANCKKLLESSGTFIISNDNSSTVKDRLSFLFLGRNRLFNLIYNDTEEVTQYVPIQEVCRLLRINGLQIDDIQYTSFYYKDLIYLPMALLIYPIQCLYIWYYKTNLPVSLKWKMFPFKHLFCKHYIIFTRKT